MPISKESATAFAQKWYREYPEDEAEEYEMRIARLSAAIQQYFFVSDSVAITPVEDQMPAAHVEVLLLTIGGTYLVGRWDGDGEKPWVVRCGNARPERVTAASISHWAYLPQAGGVRRLS